MATIRNLEELRARGVLEGGDKVIFIVKGKEMRHNVESGYLLQMPSHDGQIFTELGLGAKPERVAFARKAYGYDDTSALSNIWPAYRDGDYAAATRLVEALYLEIARQASENPETPAPAKRRTAGQQALISSAADVDAYAPLQEGDRVFFQTPQGEFSVKVARNEDGFGCQRGCSEPGTGADVFTRLGVSDDRRAREAKALDIVGAACSTGSVSSWPQYKDVTDFQKLLKGLLMAYGQIGEVAQSEPEPRMPAGPRTFTSAEELRGVALQDGDIIRFTCSGETLVMKTTFRRSGYVGLHRVPDGSGARDIFRSFFAPVGLDPYLLFEKITGVSQDGWAPFYHPYGPGAKPAAERQADIKRFCFALYDALAKAQQPQKVDTPDGPRVITTVEELRAAGTLRAGVLFQLPHPIDGEFMVKHDGDGWYGANGTNAENLVFSGQTQEAAAAYVKSIVGYVPGDFKWPEVRTAEDLAKVIEDLMIRAGQKAPFTRTPGKPVRVATVEELEAVAPLQVGDEFVVPAGGETFVVMVRRCDSGQFFGRIGGGSRDSELFSLLAIRAADFIENLIGLKPYHAALAWPDVPTLEDMTKLAKALMTHEANSKQPELAASEYVEGALLQEEDGDYRRILAVSSDGKVFALSQYTGDKDDEETLSEPGDAISLEDLVNDFTLVNPVVPVKLTRLQIAEKFGVSVEQLRIEDEAA